MCMSQPGWVGKEGCVAVNQQRLANTGEELLIDSTKRANTARRGIQGAPAWMCVLVLHAPAADYYDLHIPMARRLLIMGSVVTKLN
eukprot:SAG11_NODE_382_length_9923_cov_29.276771_4_plen_86_part_00